MTTLPADPETERLAQKVARAKGKPVAAIVRDAIEASAREAGLLVATSSRLNAAEKRQRLLEIAERSAARPRASRVIVVDTSALLAILNGEPER